MAFEIVPYGFEDLCPNIMSNIKTNSRGGLIINQSADSSDLDNLAIHCFTIDGLDLEYKRSEKGLTIEFIDYEGIKYNF